MTHLYRSPLRPLDSGYVARLAGVEPDLDHTTIGPFWPETIATRVYAFTGPLPAEIVAHLDLEEVSE